MNVTQEELSDESRVAVGYQAGNAEHALEAVQSRARPFLRPFKSPEDDLFREVERKRIARFSAYTNQLSRDVVLALYVGDESSEPLGSARYPYRDAYDRLPLATLVQTAQTLGATGVLLFNRSCADLWKDRRLFEETRLLADALEHYQITLVDRHVELTEWVSLRCRGVFD